MMKKCLSFLVVVLALGFTPALMAAHTPAVNNPQGSTYTDEEGATVQVKPDGSKLIQKADGTTVQVNPDGSKVVKTPDGTTINVKPDGSKTITQPDGTTINVPAQAKTK